MFESLEGRVRQRIRVTDSGCWEWTGARDKHGYGRMRGHGKTMFTHRYVYIELIGTADGLDLDHLCRNPSCCNPKHLEAVTHIENVRRGVASQVTKAYYRNHRFCPQGHPLFGENLYIQMTRAGYENKQCRTCVRARKRAYRERERLKGISR